MLHDMFDFEHVEIAKLLGKSEAACRQLLRRAKENVADGRRVLDASPEHRRLLTAFLRAAMDGDIGELMKLLAEDAVLIADAGPGGARYGKARNLPGPLYLTPRQRRQGIGIKTFEFIGSLLRAQKIGALELQHDNVGALAFYERIGFEKHDRIPMSKRIE